MHEFRYYTCPHCGHEHEPNRLVDDGIFVCHVCGEQYHLQVEMWIEYFVRQVGECPDCGKHLPLNMGKMSYHLNSQPFVTCPGVGQPPVDKGVPA